MIPVAAGARIWIATGHTDMRNYVERRIKRSSGRSEPNRFGHDERAGFAMKRRRFWQSPLSSGAAGAQWRRDRRSACRADGRLGEDGVGTDYADASFVSSNLEKSPRSFAAVTGNLLRWSALPLSG
jgi:hypothetical protein